MSNFWNCKLEDGQNEHHCGQMRQGNAFVPRCTVFKNAIDKLDAQPVQPNKPWFEFLQDRSTLTATFPRQENAQPDRASNARPGFCYLEGKLVPGDEVPEYLAVSYVWARAKDRTWIQWCGRDVTDQALNIAERLSKHTKLPIWIDALCIPQTTDLEIKMAEMAKMSDIYRGATLVLCLLPEVNMEACATVTKCNALMDDDSYENLRNVDIYGSFMFATLGQQTSLQGLFGSRWWERAWTFQEAVLNPQTFLIGTEEHSLPIQHVFRIADPIQRRAASVGPLACTIGKTASFWDSVSKMADAPMPVGDAMSCVWRRDAKEPHDMVYAMLGVCNLSKLITPNYKLPLKEVWMELCESASAQEDYSWSFWCHGIDHAKAEQGLCMVPTPDQVKTVPFMSITKWASSKVGSIAAKPGAEKGILLPYRSTGVVTWKSPPQSLPEMVKLLQERGYRSSEIWDLVFGMRVGLCVDVNRTVHKSGAEGEEGIALPLLNLAMAMVDGSCKISQDVLDLAGGKPHTETLGFTNFAAMAAYTWMKKKDQRLVALSSQGGTIVVPELLQNEETQKLSYTNARIHVMPIEYGGVKPEGLVTPLVAFVAHAATPFHASVVGVLVPKRGSGLGSWQLRRIGNLHSLDH